MSSLQLLTRLFARRSQAMYCTAIRAPSATDSPQHYSPEIESIVQSISSLTITQVADLNSLLKERLNIQDVAPMMMTSQAPSQTAADESDTAAPITKTLFTVRLVKFDADKKVALIKHVKSIMDGFNLVQSKKFVESIPTVVRADIPKDEADELMKTITENGGECVIE